MPVFWGSCCLGKVNLLVAGGAAEVHPQSPATQKNLTSPFFVFPCLSKERAASAVLVFAETGRLELTRSLS